MTLACSAHVYLLCAIDPFCRWRVGTKRDLVHHFRVLMCEENPFGVVEYSSRTVSHPLKAHLRVVFLEVEEPANS